MPKVEKLLIFLASPGDVRTERSHVIQVVEEVNRTVAAGKGLVLEVVNWEKHTFPDYGADAQTLVNAQIADMKRYALFVGIMWNRLGTPTPRADSGTVEEFDRAVAARGRGKKPTVMFYFRQSPANLTSHEQLEQKGKVLAFKKRVQVKGMTWDYTGPQNFRELFRNQLVLWLNQLRPAAVPAQPEGKRRPTPVTPGPAAQVYKAGAAPVPTSLPVMAKAPEDKGGKAGARPPTRVKTSGEWVLIGGNFFRAQSVAHRADGRIELRIAPQDGEEEAALRSMRQDGYRRLPVAYAYQNEACDAEVEAMEWESVRGKTTFTATLRPQERGWSGMYDFNYNGLGADQIAEMRARLLLLGEEPPKTGGVRDSLLGVALRGVERGTRADGAIFPELWRRMLHRPERFLPCARLWGVYHLKASGTCDHVLKLELGPIENGRIAVDFKGQRGNGAKDQEATFITAVGECPLPTR